MEQGLIRGTIMPGIADISACLALRREVFVEEQGFSAETEPDAMDEGALHVLLYLDDKPVATGRVVIEDGQYHIGRVCVAKAARGHHIGDMLVRVLIYQAQEMGAGDIYVGAQQQAEGFYRKLGFQPCGEPYDEEGCPHIPMKLPAGFFPAGQCHCMPQV